VAIPGRLRVRAALAAAIAAVLLAGCAAAIGDPSTAAIVDGESIPLGEVERRYEAVAKNPQFAAQLAGDATGDLRRQLQSQILGQLIRSRLLASAAEEELGITVDDAAIARKRAEIVGQLGGEDAFNAVVRQNNMSEDQVRTQLEDLVVVDLVEQRLSQERGIPEEDVRRAYEERYGANPTARHILVPTEQEAQGVLSRLAAGEDFAALAGELSQDPGSARQGGNLGAVVRGQTVPPFEEALFAAAPGQVVGPVQTDFGFHIIQRLPPPPFEEVADELRAELAAPERGQLAAEWLGDRYADARVRVNPRFGVWNQETGELTPGTPFDGPTEAPTAPASE
jgi:parvulin-like peptidyl-prolyl isomerase